MLDIVATDGFAFVEFVDRDVQDLGGLFNRMGFSRSHESSDGKVTLFQQGKIRFAVNTRPNAFFDIHGASVRGVGIYAASPTDAAERTLRAGGGIFDAASDGQAIIDAPVVRGIGESLLYFVQAGDESIFDREFGPGRSAAVTSCGLAELDHTSNIVKPENLDRWADFYANALNFHQAQYLDVKGVNTGMRSRSMVGQCGKVRIPIAASAHDTPGALNQNDEFIRDLGGEGVQHLALTTDDIFRTVDALRAQGIEFMDRPVDAYYLALDERVPGHGYDPVALSERGLLLDGKSGQDNLLQIFTRRQIGPIFFEIIQRNNHAGFGEGNFKALFEAQERDQAMRGVN